MRSYQWPKVLEPGWLSAVVVLMWEHTPLHWTMFGWWTWAKRLSSPHNLFMTWWLFHKFHCPTVFLLAWPSLCKLASIDDQLLGKKMQCFHCSPFLSCTTKPTFLLPTLSAIPFLFIIPSPPSPSLPHIYTHAHSHTHTNTHTCMLQWMRVCGHSGGCGTGGVSGGVETLVVCGLHSMCPAWEALTATTGRVWGLVQYRLGD